VFLVFFATISFFGVFFWMEGFHRLGWVARCLRMDDHWEEWGKRHMGLEAMWSLSDLDPGRSHLSSFLSIVAIVIVTLSPQNGGGYEKILEMGKENLGVGQMKRGRWRRKCQAQNCFYSYWFLVRLWLISESGIGFRFIIVVLM
jgi:hypothetical protein